MQKEASKWALIGKAFQLLFIILYPFIQCDIYQARYGQIYACSSFPKITIVLCNFVSSIASKSFNIRISNDLLQLMIYDKTFFNDHEKIL